MAAQTLSIGQAGYTLNPATPSEPGTSITAATRGTTASRIFDVRSAAGQGPVIENLGIGANNGAAYTAVQTSTVNAYDATSGLQANLGDGRDTLNLFAAADGASIELDATQVSPGGGNDLLNAQSDFINSSVAAGLGNDTVRIGGTANGSSFYLGGGNDSLYLVGASEGVYVNGDAGSDTLFFVGTQTNALVYGGADGDSITFLNGTPGGTAGGLVGTYQFGTAGVDSGSGNDTIVFGVNSSSDNFALNTGSGADVVQLNGSVTGAQISLGSEIGGVKGDSLSMTGTMIDSSVTSGNAAGDVLVFGAGSSVTNTSFALGAGNDSLVFGSTVYGDSSSSSLISLGGGNNTLTFGSTSFVGNYNIDLASGLADTISFLGNYSNVVITGANSSDVLYVGSTQYSYVAQNNTWQQLGGTASDTLRFA